MCQGAENSLRLNYSFVMQGKENHDMQNNFRACTYRIFSVFPPNIENLCKSNIGI